MDIEMICAKCKSELDAEIKNNSIVIQPCKSCFDEQYQKGVEEGSNEINDLNNEIAELNDEIAELVIQIKTSK